MFMAKPCGCNVCPGDVPPNRRGHPMNYPPGTIQQAASQLKDHLVTNLPWTFIRMVIWLVVFNHLGKYESQWEGLSHILWNIKNV